MQRAQPRERSSRNFASLLRGVSLSFGRTSGPIAVRYHRFFLLINNENTYTVENIHHIHYVCVALLLTVDLTPSCR